MVLHILSPFVVPVGRQGTAAKGRGNSTGRGRGSLGVPGRDSQYLSDIHNPLSFSVALVPGDLLHPSSQASGRQRLGKEIFGGCPLIGPIRGSRASYQGTYHGTGPRDVDRVIMAPICRLCGSRGLSGYRGSRRPIIRCPRRVMNRVSRTKSEATESRTMARASRGGTARRTRVSSLIQPQQRIGAELQLAYASLSLRDRDDALPSCPLQG